MDPEPNTANALATKVATNGNRLFPDLSPTGGEIVGLPALVSTQTPAAAGSPVANSLWLIDASGVAADAAEIEVRMSRQATVEMDTAPAGDAVAGTGLGVSSLVSLWQENLVALMAEVRFAAYRFRSNAVAVVEASSWVVGQLNIFLSPAGLASPAAPCHIRSMIDRSRKPRRPRDANQLAKLITDLATGQASDSRPTPEQDGKDPAAVSLGRRGGLKGGKARAEKLTAEQRRDIAKRAALRRWAAKVNQS